MMAMEKVSFSGDSWMRKEEGRLMQWLHGGAIRRNRGGEIVMVTWNTSALARSTLLLRLEGSSQPLPITPIREAQAPGVKVGHTHPARPPFAIYHIFPHEVKCHNFSRVS